MYRLIALLLLLSLACGRHTSLPSASDLQNRHGKERRVDVPAGKWPWIAIGRIMLPEGGHCTGTIIAQHLILTAAHCVMDLKTGKLLGGLEFEPNTNNAPNEAKTRYEFDHYWFGSRKPLEVKNTDFAILRTKVDVGTKYGILQVLGKDLKDVPDRIAATGFSIDYKRGEVLSIDSYCGIKERIYELGIFFHDCQMSPGASGGPIVMVEDAKLRIYGIVTVENRMNETTSRSLEQYSHESANMGIPGKKMISLIWEAYKYTYPEG